jgi:hypothetical protein
MRARLGMGFGLGLWIASVPVTALAQSSPPPPAATPPAPYSYPPPPYYQQPYPVQPGYPQPGYPPPGYPPQGQVPPNAYPNGYPGAYGPYAPTPPTKLPYREGAAPPPGYHIEQGPRKGLVIAGAIVLGTTYFLSASIGMASTDHDDRWLLVPVFGPFLDLGARGDRSSCSSGNLDCVTEPVIRTYLVLDGVVQATGAVLLITGLAFQKKEFVSDTYYGAENRGPRFSLYSVTPDVVPGSRYGLTLRGAIF